MSRTSLPALLLTATTFLAPAVVPAAPGPGTSATAGVRFGDDTSGGFVDLVLPVVTTEKGIGFINPRFSLEDRQENELNLGAGWRQLAFGDRVLLGGNLYFDSRYTEHKNRFNQFGIGLEVLSKWLDARANYYLPEETRELIASQETETVETAVATTSRSGENYGDPYATGHEIAQDYTLTTLTTTTTTTTTTRKLFEQFESAMEGFDAEIGALLPLPPSFPPVRLFGGYYSFEDEFGKRVEGPKGRVELRLGSFLTLDAEVFDDRELNGTSYFAGARFDTPFDLVALFAGRNPFAGWRAPAPATLASRMTEMVIRDPNVQTAESELAENEEARKVEVAVDETRTRKSSTRTFVLLDNVTFVDDGNTSGIEDGTAERPYSEIQAGVDGSGANVNVYVYDGYYASVTLLSGVTLWGEGTVVEGYGGKGYGGGAYPTIGGASPAVTVASGTRVTGFHIVNTDDPGIYGEITGGSVVIDNNVIEVASGSYAAWVNAISLITVDAQVTISGNAISSVGENGDAIALENSGSTTVAIDGNTVVSEGENNGGIMIRNSGGSLALSVAGNSITSDAAGLVVTNPDSGSLTASVSGNSVAAGDFGMSFLNGAELADKTEDTQVENPATMTVAVDGNSVSGGFYGIGFLNFGGTMAVTAANNTVATESLGILVEDLLGEGTDVTFSGNTVSVAQAGGAGIVVIELMGGMNVSLIDNTVNLSGDSQVGIQTLSISSSTDVTATGNTVNAGTGADTAGFLFSGSNSEVTLTASGNSVTGAPVVDMELSNAGGTFVVSAAEPGAGGDLSGLNGGMGVSYSPDSAAFTFVP